MKRNFFVWLAIICSACKLSTQTKSPAPMDTLAIKMKPESKDSTKEEIQIAPAYPGGEAEMFKYLYEHIKYPKAAKRNGIEGVVYCSFIVNKDGSISNVRIIRDIGRGCGDQVKQAVEQMPRWIPGQANGHPVRVRYTLPIKFYFK